ncbi:hypothetical protein [Sideroxydans lithotrophicus]|uniref:Zinc finger, DksA/TraR C4-type n=1 Tax=Sideroxydans lithotrophicus (strain ES-1) TaxID=580332 RepID=D5CUD7_SIDLE|nr:hypothetical protein [Sideroxydans lithotrophicus]ADE10472.1 zinc finger, DksA/TraR C4-type [Sideroxydans lithotrophicus ES-1]
MSNKNKPKAGAATPAAEAKAAAAKKAAGEAAAAEAAKKSQGGDDANTRNDGAGKSPEGAATQQGSAEAAAQSEPAKKPSSARKVPALSVISSVEGFRRGGRAWGKSVSTVKLSELSEGQIEQIKGESMLEVEEVEVDEEVAE